MFWFDFDKIDHMLNMSYFEQFSIQYFIYEILWYEDENFSGRIYMDIEYVVKISERFDMYWIY